MRLSCNWMDSKDVSFKKDWDVSLSRELRMNNSFFRFFNLLMRSSGNFLTKLDVRSKCFTRLSRESKDEGKFWS
uniref:Uncharacterized protein n=1 Tax=Lepeophtheirus salmonis TaxID=72036 RepID=A0A0K2T935_LEPSM